MTNWENVGKCVAKHLCLIYSYEGSDALYFKKDVYDSNIFPTGLNKSVCKQIYEARRATNTKYFDKYSKTTVYKNNLKR